LGVLASTVALGGGHRTRTAPGPCPGLRVGPGARGYRWSVGRRPSGAGM